MLRNIQKSQSFSSLWSSTLFSVRSIWLLLVVLASQAYANYLFVGATIITYDNGSEKFVVLKNASLLVNDNEITAAVAGSFSGALPSNTTVINATNKIISPGFIDTHHHLWQTVFKTIASNTTLAEYFDRYSEFSPAIQYFTPDDKYIGQLIGALELLHSGTTTVLDHAHGDSSDETTDATVNATFDSGVRTYYAHAIHELGTNYTVDDQIAKLKSLAVEPRFQNGLVSLGLAFDNFWESTSDLLNELWGIVNNYNLTVVTCHYLGGPWGITNSPTLLNTLGWLNHKVPIVFGHASYPTYNDSVLLRQTNQYISTTPESELHYGHGHPEAFHFQDQAALGVDTHFTYNSTMVLQARLWLQSLRDHNFQKVVGGEWEIPTNNPMSVEQAFSLITRAGGLALRRSDLGVIQVGARADLVVFGTDSPNMVGWSDAIAAIIMHSNVGDVEDVMVDGKFVKQNGQLIRTDYPDLVKRFKASASRIQQIWSTIAPPQLVGLFENYTPYATADTIDTQRGPGTGY